MQQSKPLLGENEEKKSLFMTERSFLSHAHKTIHEIFDHRPTLGEKIWMKRKGDEETRAVMIGLIPVGANFLSQNPADKIC